MQTHFTEVGSTTRQMSGAGVFVNNYDKNQRGCKSLYNRQTCTLVTIHHNTGTMIKAGIHCQYWFIFKRGNQDIRILNMITLDPSLSFPTGLSLYSISSHKRYSCFKIVKSPLHIHSLSSILHILYQVLFFSYISKLCGGSKNRSGFGVCLLSSCSALQLRRF